MAATAQPLFPFDVWVSQQVQAATIQNDNALRAEVISLPALSFEATQPVSPSDGDLYVLSAAWGEEVTGTLAFYRDGWTYWIPFDGMRKFIGGVEYIYSAGSTNDWAIAPGAGNVIVPVQIAVSDETTALTTGAGKVTFRMPFAMTLQEVRASVTTAPTGAAIEVDINEGGVSILSTPITIDAGEKTSVTAATPAVISDSSLADDAEITIDIDQVGSTIAGAGLKVTLIGYKTP